MRNPIRSLAADPQKDDKDRRRPMQKDGGPVIAFTVRQACCSSTSSICAPSGFARWRRAFPWPQALGRRHRGASGRPNDADAVSGQREGVDRDDVAMLVAPWSTFQVGAIVAGGVAGLL